MSTLAEQVVEQLKTDMDNVYDAGYQKGKSEGGGGEGLDVSKFGIINEVTGTNIATCDYVNENPHNVEVKLSSDTVTDFSGVEVKACGKNLFYKANEYRATCDIPLPKGTTIIFSAEETWNSIMDLICASGETFAFDLKNVFNGRRYDSFTLTKDIAQIRFRGTAVEPQIAMIFNTDYEPYTETTYTANADGTLNIPSISPTMNIICDTEGVNVSAKYYCSPTAEYDRFWDYYQENGKRTVYVEAFYGQGWNDKTFKPKYLIKPIGDSKKIFMTSRVSKFDETVVDLTKSDNLADAFYYSPNLKRVSIDVETAKVLTYSFYNCTVLEEVSIFNIRKECNIDYCFGACPNLKKVNITGEISNSVSMAQSNLLETESAKNIILCLVNYFGTTNQSKHSVKFHTQVWARLAEEGNTSPNGNSWEDYVADLGWLT